MSKNPKPQSLSHQSTIAQQSSIKSPTTKSPFTPSFTCISSSQLSFQQTSNQMRIPSERSLNSSHSFNHTMEELNMINDGIQYVFEFTKAEVEDDDIMDIFDDITIQQEFQMIERENNYCTAIKKSTNKNLMSKVNFAEILANCFPFFSEKSHNYVEGMSSKAPTAIKLIISKCMHNQAEKKICRVKGLSGSIKQIRLFIQKFKQKVSHYIPQGSQQFSNYFFYDPQKQSESQTKNGNEYSDPYHLEINTFYALQKILSNKDMYEIGKITYNLLQDYKNTFKNVQESVLLVPQPISDAIKIVNEIYYWFTNGSSEETQLKYKTKSSKKVNKHLNQKQKQKHMQKSQQNIKINRIKLHQSMTPFIRISIQKFVFKKLSHPIIDIYAKKALQNDKIFNFKRNKIFQKYTTKQILEQISLNQKFWAVLPQNFDKLENINDRKTTRQLVTMSKICCQQLEKIVLTTNPRQKIKHIQLAYTGLKTFYYDFSKHTYELSSMQDIIPVLILTVLLSNIENFRKELDIMGDFIECDPYEMQSQKRLFINLSESYNYIVRDWKV